MRGCKFNFSRDGSPPEPKDEFWVDRSMEISVLSRSYKQILSDLPEMQAVINRRLGGAPAIGPVDTGHWIAFLEDIIEEHLD